MRQQTFSPKQMVGLLAGVAFVALASCGGGDDGGNGPGGPVASTLIFLSQPSASEAGSTISPSVQVSIVDANGDLVTTSTAPVTLAVGTNPGGATLAGVKTVNAVGGVATFAGLSLNKATAGYTLVATSGGLTSATSITFAITPGAPAIVSKAGGDNQTAGTATAVTIAPSVSLRDALGNSTPGIAITFAVTSGGGSVDQSIAATDANGVATVGRWSLGDTPGANTLTATATGSAIVGNPVSFTATAARRAGAERPDDAAGSMVHIFYLLPSDGTDRGLDTNGTLANTIGSFQHWLSGQTGGRVLRMDNYQGGLDITFVRLSRSNALMTSYGAFARDTIEKDLAGAGFAATDKIYAVYYDGGNTFACGGGSWPPVLPGRVGALYLQGTISGAPPCSSNPFATSPTAAPGYLEFAMIHELMHVQGIVSSGAPNFTLSGHVNTDPTDLMYAGALPWQPSVLDFNKQNYYNPSGLPAGLFNLAESPFLAP